MRDGGGLGGGGGGAEGAQLDREGDDDEGGERKVWTPKKGKHSLPHPPPPPPPTPSQPPPSNQFKPTESSNRRLPLVKATEPPQPPPPPPRFYRQVPREVFHIRLGLVLAVTPVHRGTISRRLKAAIDPRGVSLMIPALGIRHAKVSANPPRAILTISPGSVPRLCREEPGGTSGDAALSLST